MTVQIETNRILNETFLTSAIWLAETTSTNSVALSHAVENRAFPALIGAESQTQGRGRNQNQWWANQGALTFSLLIAPRQFGIPRSEWPFLSLVTGLSVCRTLEVLLPNCLVQLKWPNDVYANHRKICGILHETVAERPELLIVGVGINVNNSLKEAPDELQLKATSLRDLHGAEFDRTQILIDFLHTFESELRALGQADPVQIDRCRERCYLSGKLVTLRELNEEVTGMCLGIDNDGALRMMTEFGPQRFLAGEILRIENS